MADRKIQKGINTEANEREIARWRDYMTAQVENYNTRLAGGKWSGMMPGLVTGANLMLWSSQVRWPWGEKAAQTSQPGSHLEGSSQPATGQKWRYAATVDRRSQPGTAAWRVVDGLGRSGRALALLPAGLQSAWADGDANAPYLEFDFETNGGTAEAFLDFLPTFRIYPGMKLRVAVSVDGQTPTLVEVPGSGGAEDERGTLRAQAVQDNYVRTRVSLPGLAGGKHTFKITAVDPGIVVDRVSLP
jgi:hypothetical protein